MTRDIPIIFSAPMVRALIEGRKTMTRRLARTERKIAGPGSLGGDSDRIERPSPWQRVKPGDRLWVRENWGCPSADRPGIKDGRKPRQGDKIVLQANDADAWQWRGGSGCGDFVWRPSIHMPRWASRLTLIVTATKIEKLQEIPLRDVGNEGCEVRQFWLFGADGPERQKIGANVFGALWSELHGAESWAANPLVVALTFRSIAANIDSKEAQL